MTGVVAVLLLFLAMPFVLWPLIKTPEEPPDSDPHLLSPSAKAVLPHEGGGRA